jgi:hypothetical protein
MLLVRSGLRDIVESAVEFGMEMRMQRNGEEEQN